MVKIVKRKLAKDSAFGSKTRYRYDVGSWSFPSRAMAEAHVKRLRKYKK